MKQPIVIVITGGSCAYKTTIVQLLKNKYPDKLLCSAESATMLMANGFPDYDHNMKQKAIWHVQVCMEIILLEKAKKDNYKVILLDRGIMDGIAYAGNNVLNLIDIIHDIDILSRYDKVIHLETAAKLDDSSFDLFKLGNIARIEKTKEEAIYYDNKIKDVYSGHTNRIIIPASGSIAATFDAVEKIILEYI